MSGVGWLLNCHSSDYSGLNELTCQNPGLGPRTTVDEMIVEMVTSDLDIAKKHRLLKESGDSVNPAKE